MVCEWVLMSSLHQFPKPLHDARPSSNQQRIGHALCLMRAGRGLRRSVHDDALPNRHLIDASTRAGSRVSLQQDRTCHPEHQPLAPIECLRHSAQPHCDG